MNLPDQLTDITDRPRGWWENAPQTQRLGAIGGAAALVIALVFALSSMGGGEEEWDTAILYTNLDFQEAGEIANRLADLGMRYRLSSDGSAILVPRDEERDLRLQLAGEGFPKSGRMGYEIFEEAQLAMTDFLQRVNLKRALQEELEETILAIDNVKNARVHLVTPEPSLFTEEQNSVTASVVLTMASGTKLKPKHINSIVHLVSASVEGLEVEEVVVVDSEGNMLSEEHDPLVAAANKQFQMQQQVERVLEKKVQSLMDEVIGRDRSRVRVNVVLDFSQRESTETIADPGQTRVVVSEETNEKSSAEQGSEENAVRNYEVNRTFRRILGAVGTVSRISMALTVDQTKVVYNSDTETYDVEDRTQAEIDQLRDLATAAVGIDGQRGDEVSVYSMPFDKSQEIQARKEVEDAEAQEFWTGIAINVAKILGIIAALITLRFIIQAIGRGVGVEEEVEVLGEILDDVDEEEFERPETPHEITLRRVQDIVRERPEDAAKLIRTMLMEENT